MTRVLLLLVLACVLALPAAGQTKTEQAALAMENGFYEDVVSLLEPEVQGLALPEDQLQAARWLIAQASVMRADTAAARRYMRAWIDAHGDSPPQVNPETERLRVYRAYLRVQREWNVENLCPPNYTPPSACEHGGTDPDPSITTVGIVDFENNSVSDREELDPLRAQFADALTRRVAVASRLSVVDRERLDLLLEEIERGGSGAIDPATAARAGRLLGAQLFILGDFFYMGRTMVVGARVVETETGRVLPVLIEVEGGRDDVLEMVDGLAERFAEYVGVHLPEPEVEEYPQTLDVLKAYRDGFEYEGTADSERAIYWYERALELDPGYAPARRRLELLESERRRLARAGG